MNDRPPPYSPAPPLLGQSAPTPAGEAPQHYTAPRASSPVITLADYSRAPVITAVDYRHALVQSPVYVGEMRPSALSTTTYVIRHPAPIVAVTLANRCPICMVRIDVCEVQSYSGAPFDVRVIF